MTEKYHYIIVPVKVEALCVGENIDDGILSDSFTPAHCDFSGIGEFYKENEPFVSDAYVKRPFSLQSPSNVQPGVHLHWRLPAALCRATGDESQDIFGRSGIEFFRIPNRWLVTRVHTFNILSNDPETAMKSWLVESDYISRTRGDGPVTNIPYFKDCMARDSLTRYMGRVISLGSGVEWSEDKAAERFEDLTAIGYGDPAFASFYPDCRTVLGFHDTELVKDGFEAKSGKISYSVIGWYSNTDDDPVSMAAKNKKLDELLEYFNWEMQGDFKPSDVCLLCNGFVYDVEWKPDSVLMKNRFDPNEIKISLGNTASEGLAALLKKCSDYPYDGSEELLESLQMNRIDGLEGVDAMAGLEKTLHANTFGSESAGGTWRIENTQENPEFSLQEENALLEKFINPLNRLNKLQENLNRINEKIEDLRKQLYADWYKYMIYKYEDLKGMKIQLRKQDIYVIDLREYIRGFMVQKNTYGDSLEQLITRREALEAELNRLAGKDGLFRKLPEGYELKPADASRFFFPNEPVLTIASKDLKPSSNQYGQIRWVQKQDFLEVTDGVDELWKNLIQNKCINDRGHILATIIPLETAAQISLDDPFIDKQAQVFNVLKRAVEGTLLCRNETQLVSSMKVAVNGSDLNVGLDQFPSLSQTAHLPVCVNRLVAELMFVSPCHAPYVVSKAAGPGHKDDLALYRDGIKQQFKRGVNFYKECVVGGVLPSKIDLNKWKWPWYPLFLHWEIVYWPLEQVESKITEQGVETRTCFKKDLITSNFDFFDHSIELEQKNAKFADFDPPPYSGITLLTPYALQNLQDQVIKFFEKYKNEQITSIAKKLDHMQVLSQAISGFNESLLTFDSRLQFPVFDPPERDKDAKDFTKDIFESVKGRNSASPAPNANFNPIRAGYMRVSKIRVVDAFGQHKEIENPPVYVSRTYAPQKPLEKKYGNIYLSPRIVQPSRLQLNWITDEQKVLTHTEYSENPVCGWIVANFLDRSIMVFDQNGKSLGSIKERDDQCVFKINPGDEDRYGDQWEDQVKNKYLKGFIKGFLKKGRGYLDRYVRLTERAFQYTAPESNGRQNILSLMLGRPVALARIRMAFVLKGFPAVNQGWNSLVWDIGNDSNNMDQRDTADFEKVDFPVRLGCSMEKNEYHDGLIGYFKETGHQTDYDGLYSFYAESGGGDIAIPENSVMNFTRGNNGGSQATFLLLFDPHGKIHVSTGILPKQHIELPERFYTEALHSMTFTFLSTPFLMDEEQLKDDKKIEMTLPEDEDFEWHWLNRKGKKYCERPVENPLETKDTLPKGQEILEGWLKLSKKENQKRK